MSMHREDWEALGTRVTDAIKAHPLAAVAIGCAIAGFVIGKLF